VKISFLSDCSHSLFYDIKMSVMSEWGTSNSYCFLRIWSPFFKKRAQGHSQGGFGT